MLWGVLFWAAITYMVVSPDKTSLAASRGFWGAVRGFAKPGRTSSKNGRPGATKGPRARFAGLLDGWRDGVRVARQRRANGKDLWSRGTYVAGRVYGGAGSIRAGVRRLKLDLGVWRAKRAAKKGGPTVEGFVVDEQPTTSEQPKTSPGGEASDAPAGESAEDPVARPRRRRQPFQGMGRRSHDWVCLPCFDEIQDELQATRPSFRPRYLLDARPVLVADLMEDLVDADHTCARCDKPFAELYPAAANNAYAHHIAGPEGNNRAYCGLDFSAPAFGQLMSLADHPECDACCSFCRVRATAEATTADRDVVQGEVVAIAPTKDLAADQAAEGAPSEGEGAPSTTTKPAMAGEENTMSINTTELESLDAVAAEVERAQQMCAALAETLEATKAWAQGLIDRWGGTNWGTDEIDTGVAEAADAVSTLGDTEPLDMALRSISTAVHNARSLAEVADEVGAKGSIDAFRAS